jgi:hypothetical protein
MPADASGPGMLVVENQADSSSVKIGSSWVMSSP